MANQPQLQQESETNTVRGPIFVSIGSVDKLKLFLEKNPKIPADQILVDDYEHKSYKQTMGFERFDEIKSINQLRGLDPSKLVIPLLGTLGVSKLLNYVQNVLVYTNFILVMGIISQIHLRKVIFAQQGIIFFAYLYVYEMFVEY